MGNQTLLSQTKQKEAFKLRLQGWVDFSLAMWG